MADPGRQDGPYRCEVACEHGAQCSAVLGHAGACAFDGCCACGSGASVADLALEAHAAARACNDLADRLETVTGHVILRLRRASEDAEDRIVTALASGDTGHAGRFIEPALAQCAGALAEALADIAQLPAGLSTAGTRARAIVEEVSRG